MCLNILCPHIQIAGRRLMRIAATGVASALLVPATGQASVRQRPEPVVATDNTRPAGRIAGDTATIRLRAAAGHWQPERPDGPVLTVDAFGEEGAALTVPAPLIRVAEGVSIAVSIRNDLATPLRVHGLCARDGGAWGGRCFRGDPQDR